MCELFGMSASAATRPDRLLRAFRLRGGIDADNPDGWGLGFWDNAAFRIFKEPEPAAHSARFGELCDTVSSHLVVAHVRKARHPPINTMTNTHPFVHACCGRQWVFAHNGLVPGVVELEMAHPTPVCRPTGETDSEHAFCHLLGRVAETFERASPGDPVAWMGALAAVSELLTSYGKFNFLMSDGEHLIAYGHDRLHHAEQHDADPSTDKPLKRVVVATEPIADSSGWIGFGPGELRVYRLGKLAGRMLTRPFPAPRLSENDELVSTGTST
jgi:glutamine amidotransferase